MATLRRLGVKKGALQTAVHEVLYRWFYLELGYPEIAVNYMPAGDLRVGRFVRKWDRKLVGVK